MVKNAYTSEELKELTLSVGIRRLKLNWDNFDEVLSAQLNALSAIVWREYHLPDSELSNKQRQKIKKIRKQTERLRQDVRSVSHSSTTSNENKSLYDDSLKGLSSLLTYCDARISDADIISQQYKGSSGNRKRVKKDMENVVAQIWQTLEGTVNKDKHYKRFFTAALEPIYKRHPQRNKLQLGTFTGNTFENHVDSYKELIKEAEKHGIDDPFFVPMSGIPIR